MDTQRPLSLNHPGETLALVRRTFGFLPEDSLVVIGLQDGVTGGHLRVDLPAGAAAAGSGRLRDFAESVAGCLADEEAAPSPGAVLAVLFAPEPARPGESPYQGLVGALRRSFAERGAQVVRSWYAGGGHIRDYDCREETCCGYPGLDARAELRQALQEHPMFAGPDGPPYSSGEGATGGPGQVVARFEETPFDEGLYGAGEIAQVREAVRAHGRRFARLTREAGRPPYLCVAAWDAAISRAEACGTADWLAESPDQIAAMLAAVADSGLRDTIIPMAALDFDTAVYGYLAFCAARRTGLEPAKAAELLGEEGRPVPEDLGPLVEDYQSAFLGQTGRRPDWDRVDALERTLRMVFAFAEGQARPHILGLMGWLEWARGRGSIAGAYIDRCLAEYPEDQLAQLIGRYMDVGGICPWARVKRHSWSWSSRRWKESSPKFLPPSGNEQQGAPVMAC